MKVLIFGKKSTLKNTGGPLGYMYNISEYLKFYPNESVEFLKEERIGRSFFSMIKSVVFVALRRFFSFSKFLKALFDIYSYYFMTIKLNKKTIEYFNKFDFIHIHVPPSFLLYFKKTGLKSKLILTSHSPEPYSDEFFNNIGWGNFYWKHPRFRNYFLKREVRVFDKCDYVMFPVPQAREPYENVSPIHKLKFKSIEDKFIYVPTALNSVDEVTDNDHVISSMGLSNVPFKICYIGRHNHVKGYDFLKESAQDVWQQMPDVHYFIGGKEMPFCGLDDARWHELGWVNTPHLLNEVDVFVLPNQDTYFDLILLEALRQGIPVVLSKTGGNKWFENKEVDGLFFFEYGNSESLVKQLVLIRKLKEECKIDGIKESNRYFCKTQFNMKLYMERYLSCLESLKSK